MDKKHPFEMPDDNEGFIRIGPDENGEPIPLPAETSDKGPTKRQFGNDRDFANALLRANPAIAGTALAVCCTQCGREYFDLTAAEIQRLKDGRGCPSNDCPGYEANYITT